MVDGKKGYTLVGGWGGGNILDGDSTMTGYVGGKKHQDGVQERQIISKGDLHITL